LADMALAAASNSGKRAVVTLCGISVGIAGGSWLRSAGPGF
jgi:hypothetical protein